MTKKIPREDLLDDLTRVAEKVDRAPTQEDYNEHGTYSTPTYHRRFGSWMAALTAAGHDPENRRGRGYRRSRSELLTEMDRLADELDRPPTMDEMETVGAFSPRTYINRFGSWTDALEAAGLSMPADRGNRPIPKEELREELAALGNKLGRPPTEDEMDALGKFSTSTYQNRFGSWGRALRLAGFDGHDILDRGFGLHGDGPPDGVQVTVEDDRLTLSLPGSPRRVRAFNAGGEFGVIAEGYDRAAMVADLAAGPEPETVWDALAAALATMAEAGCTQTQIIDYLAVEKCGWEPGEWARAARRPSISPRGVEKNVAAAREALAAADKPVD